MIGSEIKIQQSSNNIDVSNVFGKIFVMFYVKFLVDNCKWDSKTNVFISDSDVDSGIVPTSVSDDIQLDPPSYNSTMYSRLVVML